MDRLVFPAVSQITFIGIEANEPSFVNETKALGRFTVVFVHFRQAVRKVVFLVINGMVKGQLNEVEFRKNLLHL
jgi:hypothetical protein